MTTYEKLLRSENRVAERVAMTDEDQRLNLAYENLSKMPTSLVNNFCTFIRILDISHNDFRDVSFLKDFKNLTALILDHNKIDENTVFPALVSVDLLWLNHNKIALLFPFIKNLQKSFPKLQQLSLMDNPGVPLDIDDTTFYQHLQYRLFTISFFPQLKHLDSRDVSQYEHEEASRLYKRPWYERLIENSSSAVNSAYISFSQLFSKQNNGYHENNSRPSIV